MTSTRVSQSILAGLQTAVSSGIPAISTVRGDLFIASESGMGAIRLKIPLADYLHFVHRLDVSVRPPALWIAPQEHEQFQVAVLVPLTVRDGKVVADGRSVIVL